MTDTDTKIEVIMRDMLMRKSGVDRLKMGASMFDMAKKIILASLGSKSKEEMFLRFYGNDFDENRKARILKHLGRVHGN